MSARSIRRSHQREQRRRGRLIARRAGLAVGAVAAAAAIAAPNAAAANLPVSTLADSGIGSLRNQIVAANAAAGPDTITFTGAAASGEIVLATEVPITDDLTINGPGAGQLAISGDSDNDNVHDFATGPAALGDSRIFDVSDPSSPGAPLQHVSISGVTLKEGVADSWGSGVLQDESGGAIYAEDAAVALTNVTLTNNVATGGGGAVYLGSPTAGRFEATGSTFTSNEARDGNGGAVTSYPLASDSVGTKISSSGFSANRSAGLGGAISARYEVQISDTTISGNSAGFGGGAHLTGDGAVQRSTITANTASVGGGTVLSGVDLRYSTVSENSARIFGGGVFSIAETGGATRIDSSTVSGNSTSLPFSSYGGGGVVAYGSILPADSPVLITRNSTIASNTAANEGGGVLAVSLTGVPASPLASLKSTIVADNTAAGAANDLSGMTVEAGALVDMTNGFAADFSLIEAPGGSSIAAVPAGSNITGIDPKLSPLAANGGPTQTQTIAPTSAAVDSAQANGFTTDQTGGARTVDAVATNAPLSDGTDIGAVELNDPAAVGGDPSTDFAKKPPKKVKAKGKKGKKVKLTFTGTVNSGAPGPLSFECKVDKGKFEECTSPLKLKLKKGKHTIEVRAIDSTGRVDSSPAKAKIKVKKKKPKK